MIYFSCRDRIDERTILISYLKMVNFLTSIVFVVKVNEFDFLRLREVKCFA